MWIGRVQVKWNLWVSDKLAILSYNATVICKVKKLCNQLIGQKNYGESGSMDFARGCEVKMVAMFWRVDGPKVEND